MGKYIENKCFQCGSSIWSNVPPLSSQSTPGVIRAASIAFSDKVGCEIGSAGCGALRELSKTAARLYSFDYCEEIIAECKKREYACPVDFLKMDPLRDADAFTIFDDSPMPQIFFWWLGYPTSEDMFLRIQGKFPEAQFLINCNTAKGHLRLWRGFHNLKDPELRFYATDSCVCEEPIFLDITGVSEEAVKAVEPAQSRVRTSLGAYREGQKSVFATYNLNLAHLSGSHTVDSLLPSGEQIKIK